MHHAGKVIAPLAALVVLAGLPAAVASARSTAAPQNTAVPTISGQAREASTLTATDGTWTSSPTSFTYQWQRCDVDGSNCAGIADATSKTYTPIAADVDHRVRVVVTARNADGSATADSAASAIVSSTAAPVDAVKPTVAGASAVGEVLTADPGTWTGGVRTYAYQWQRCAAGAVAACTNVVGATRRTYTVRGADVGSALRVIVIASNAGSSKAPAASDVTDIVTESMTTVVRTTTTKVVNHPPTISLLAARQVGARVYVRFRVCDDSPGRISILERDTKQGLSYRRRFSVSRCAAYARSWRLTPYFRHGRIRVSLQAMDKSRKSSRTVSRTVR